jgi:hypothetical protein
MLSYPSCTTTARSTDNWREFWRLESARTGSDWISLFDAAGAALSRLRAVHVGSSS